MSAFVVPPLDTISLDVNGQEKKFAVDSYALYDELNAVGSACNQEQKPDSEWAEQVRLILRRHGIDVEMTVRGLIQFVKFVYEYVHEQKKSDLAFSSLNSPDSTGSGPVG